MRRAVCCVASVMVVAMLTCLLPGVVRADNCELPVFDPADFASPQENIYFPEAVGYTYVYEADTEDGLARNYIHITDETVTIAGVECRVIYDVEWLWLEDEDEGQWVKLEETDDWHAWDNYGNVWYFGESTVEFLFDDDWNPDGFSTEGSWEAGVDGAEPGIVMLADPLPGVCYLQEYFEDEAEDRGKVLRLNAAISIDFGDFEDCLVTKEWTKLEPGNVEHKYYAPGVGLVYIEELKEKTVRVELVDEYLGAPPETPASP